MDNPEQPTSMGNEVIDDRNSWNPRMEKAILQRNGIGQSSNSWTPVTPEKLMNERSNTVPVDKQLETEKWEDLIGMYTGLLQEKAAPSPNYRDYDYGSRNLNPYQDHTYLKKNEAADWNTNLLAGPKKCSTPAPIPNQVASGSTSWTCMLGSQQTLGFTSNNLINDAHNRKDGFPVPYQPCYNPSSPPRSEQYTAASTIIDSFPSALITPDDKRKHMDSQWVPQNANFPAAETSTPAKDRHENRSMYNELLQSIGDSPSSAVSTTQKEYVPENRDEQGIDLSKTPQQKTPTRRKKHRPKVIREGKAKRTPKAKGPSNGTSNEPRVKRKYVRKKGLNISETQGDDNKEKTPEVRVKRKYVRKKGIDNFRGQQKGRVDEVPTSTVETPAKSCKRQLNFELDHVAQDESHDIRKNQQAKVAVSHRDISKRPAIEIAQQNKSIGATMQSGNRSSTELNVPTIHLASARHHALNMLARSVAMRNGEGMENAIFQAGMVSTNLERATEPSLLGTPQSFASLNERRGIKRQSSEQMCRNINDMDSVLLYQKMLLGVARRAYERNNLSGVFLENHKKTKMQSQFQEARQMNGIFRNGSPMHLQNSCTRRVDPSCKAMNVGGNVNSFQFQPPLAATHYIQKHEVFGVRHHAIAISSVPERSQNYNHGHQIGSTAAISWNPSKETSRYVVTAYPATLLEKRQGAKPSSYNQRLYGSDEMLQQHRYNLCKGYQQSSTIAKGQARRQKTEVSVDDVTCKLEGLHIYDENKKEQRGLVLYRRDAAIIPFEPVKKRIPRPKVDLDPETGRLWTLLMGKEGSEDAATPDKNKEKWWENERRVFRGRVDSFIARMHLVQGDRKFSRWKGSVVDSVIGVFLTQNVSDHISSSAFMSLAAKFPPKSSTTNGTCCQDGACEGPIEVAVPNDIIKCHEEPLSNQSSFVSSEPSENLTHQSPSTRSAASRISEEEVIISQDSLDSSTTQPIDEIRSSSGSNSEAEDATTGFEISKQSDPPVNLIKKEKPTMFKDLSCQDNCTTLLDEPNTSMHHVPKEPEDDIKNVNSSSSLTSADSSIHLLQESLVSSSHISMTPGPQKVCSLQLGEENTSSLPSSNSGMTKADHTSNGTYPQNEMSKFPTPSLGQYNLPSSHPAHQENFHPEPPVWSSQLSNTHHQRVTELLKEATGQSQTLEKGKSGAQKQDSAMFGGISIVDNQICFESTVTEANSKEQNYAYHEPPTGADTNMSKTSKRTADEEQNKVIDWDNLRKQVLSNGEKRERSKGAMDSLDYEALRCAHVSEISDAIRERGMNNLLADRIKNFLNRLVKDHEKVDLEWLRDAPPDKAKDYLLSIRGLGLKSVECVRLLTLHHLAFPVDTNVGRIAVRLGWVPLQTLPESLQLHLLEMYPVLESIQKYLWPRLCKLDQLTLYELHYQMITFGKVFCTKSKPNCNACPMRAECRHFASAFASARLALPAPEEKRMMTSDAPDPITHVVIRPMLLPPAENGLDESAKSFGRNCEPIIEEPTTPEPEAAELSIADIEDQYYEDSDEIPSIKLNMEEFTTNLQNIMQDSMELKEDVSKALVALNPTAAFIPTPKLKDVSRLRTEHQVYELPDSHRLLEGLDKREPDDPSPYLLAIWTPGETANSVLPPQRGCSAQESGKLCDRTTCFSCNNMKEANSQVVRGTILIPCRTAMRGSFPLNGTYFQVNEMFADHASSLNPIDVPRMWIWNLPRRIVYFGTSVTTIFKGLTTEGIQYCFWKGFVCVRGFDRETRTPRPLMARLHFPASKLVKTKNEGK